MGVARIHPVFSFSCCTRSARAPFCLQCINLHHPATIQGVPLPIQALGLSLVGPIRSHRRTNPIKPTKNLPGASKTPFFTFQNRAPSKIKATELGHDINPP